MKHRSKEAWLELIKLQSQSQLSVLEFCRQQNISSSCFYKHKSDNKERLSGRAAFKTQETQTSSSKNTFVKAECSQHVLSTDASIIQVQYGDSQITLPVSTQPIWLADFVKALT